LSSSSSSIIFFFRDEELGWTDDGTDDGTDGWKGGLPDRQTPRILLCWRWVPVTFEHCEIDLFLDFSLGILGEAKQKKSAKVAIFIEFVIGDRQKKNKIGFYEFLFPRLAFSQKSSSCGGWNTFNFFSFLFLFSKVFFCFFFFSSSFLEQIQAKNPK
jgi:hypothetical protein